MCTHVWLSGALDQEPPEADPETEALAWTETLTVQLPPDCERSSGKMHRIAVTARESVVERVVTDGEVVPLVTELPDPTDGTRGSFLQDICTAGELRVYRYSWCCEEMYDNDSRENLLLCAELLKPS